MTGIVLCGGQSLRMGSDKGLLTIESKTWAESAYNKIAELHINIKISVNKQQQFPYSAMFTENDLIADDPSLQIRGPLLGVLSSHTYFPSEDLLVLACDMALMETSVIRQLYDVYDAEPGFDAYVYLNDGEYEPLCAIYTVKALSHVLSMLSRGTLLKHSMKFMISQLVVKTILVREEQKKCFRNFNSHAELNGQ